MMRYRRMKTDGTGGSAQDPSAIAYPGVPAARSGWSGAPQGGAAGGTPVIMTKDGKPNPNPASAQQTSMFKNPGTQSTPALSNAAAAKKVASDELQKSLSEFFC
jgi:hypothetical protein